MNRDTSTSRRRFTKALTGASLAGITFLAGCGEESAYDGEGGDGGGGGGGGGDGNDSGGGGNDSGGGGNDSGGGGNETTTTENETTTTQDGGGGSKPSFDGFLENTSNYDGVTDQTGTDTITVTVGAQGNDGNFAFEPAAVRISTGTTVQWEWTGEGGQHNAVEQDDTFASDLYEEAGVHFEHEFSESGTFKYICEPHDSLGMRGVIVVE